MNNYFQLVSLQKSLSDLKPLTSVFKLIPGDVRRVATVVMPLIVALLVFTTPRTALAKFESTILQQCREISLADNDIHNCLDNHLDLMDDNLSDLLAFIRGELASSLDLSLIHI